MLRGAKTRRGLRYGVSPPSDRLRIPGGGWFQKSQAPDRDTRFEAMQSGPLAAAS